MADATTTTTAIEHSAFDLSMNGTSEMCASSLNKSPDLHSIVGSETRTVHDPFLNKDVQVSDRLIDRLRGRYACGPIMPNGEPEFGWREFEAPPIQHEAATIISELQAERDRIERNRDMWKGQCERQAASLTTMRDLLSRVNQLGVTGGWRRLPDGGLFSATPLADDIASAIRSLTNGGSGGEAKTAESEHSPSTQNTRTE